MSVEPAPWHIAVTPSEVDPHEEQRPTGLIVQHAHDHSEGCPNALKRGVIMALGQKVNDNEASWDLKVGDVIFYHRGITLQGLEYVYPSYDNVIAVEREPRDG